MLQLLAVIIEGGMILAFALILWAILGILCFLGIE